MTTKEVKEIILEQVSKQKANGRSAEYIRAWYGGMIFAFKKANVITPDEAAEILNDIFEEVFM